MVGFLTLLLGLSLLLTLVILITGLIGMVKPAFNDKWGNKLMRFRIISQVTTVVLFILLLLARAA